LNKLLFTPVNSSSLAAYRIIFGLLSAVGLIRFWLMGWIERCFTGPEFHFKYYGFEWIQMWPGQGIYIHFAVMIAACFCIAAGLFTRIASLLFFLGFSYIELLDQSNYLNHYYLVMLLAFINVFLPLNARWSLDNQLGLSERREWLPSWTLNLVRLQVGTVYFFAGLAKLGYDWLIEAQPLNIWLTAHRDMPVIGRLLEYQFTHYAASWAGFLFDTTIVLWMLIPRTRRYAYMAILGFHTFTYLLFPIGLFPFIMVLMALLVKSVPAMQPPGNITFAWRPAVVAGFTVYAALQIAIPFRHLLYPGEVLWNEEGMRWSWKVMAREKSGDVNFRVQERSSGRVWYVSPSEFLMRHQELEMSVTPDMILQFAHFLKDRFASRGQDVAVYAETMTSYNGRLAKPLIDSKVDLTQVKESFLPKTWILPAPSGEPHRVTFQRSAR
jgi:vitamin K-dependent gamma-carboxylase